MAGTGRIADLVAKLDAMSSPQWMGALSQRLAERTLQLIDDGFKGERDPYGNRWEKTKQPHQILQLSGALRRSWSIQGATPDGFTVASSSDYAAAHQYGTSHLPPRRMVPDGQLGDKWTKAYDQVVVSSIRELMRG